MKEKSRNFSMEEKSRSFEGENESGMGSRVVNQMYEEVLIVSMEN